MKLSNCVDNIPLEFGRFKGKTPLVLAPEDPRYVCWMYETISPKPCSKELYDMCHAVVFGDVSEEDDRDLDQFYESNGW